MSLPCSKSTAGMISIGAVALMIITLFLIPGMDKNADAITQHEKLEAHPVAMNEFQHINEKLDSLQRDTQLTKEIVARNYQILCSIYEKC